MGFSFDHGILSLNISVIRDTVFELKCYEYTTNLEINYLDVQITFKNKNMPFL